MNTLKFGNYSAVIQYDSDIELFRGEFINLNGGADFYADNIQDLKIEGQKSLDVFLEMCAENNIEPKKNFSGKFNVRVPSSLHEQAVIQARANNKSLNEWVSDAIAEQAQDAR